jgi:putative peptidoglycan lipid II flippase
MVSVASLDFAEMGRCLLAAGAGGGAAWLVAWGFAAATPRLPGIAQMRHAHYWLDTAILLASLAVWTLIAKGILQRSGSDLPRVAMKRLGLA